MGKPRPTFPECCATCEHRAVDTRMGIIGDKEIFEEEVYCFYDLDTSKKFEDLKKMKFPNPIDEVLHVCDRYEPSWGVQQLHRRLCGLPELPVEFYPYRLARRQQGSQERLKQEYAVLSKNQLLKPERQLEIWNEGLDEHWEDEEDE